MAGPGRPGRPRGRPPRHSSSSAEPGRRRGKDVAYQRELAIFKPRDPAVTNDWSLPCFVLKDATVYAEDGKTMTNLTNILYDGPFVIRGLLEVDDDRQYLRNPSLRRAHIEVHVSYNYSIGYGPLPVVWALGETAWFEIGNPAPRYREICGETWEGITLYYLLMGAYEEINSLTAKQKRALRGTDRSGLDIVFFKYAVALGDGCVRDEVEERCHKHAKFIIAHFSKETTFQWESTEFYRWMHKSHPDIVRDSREAQAKIEEKGAAAAASMAARPTPSRRSRSARSRSAQSLDKAEAEDTEMGDIPFHTGSDEHREDHRQGSVPGWKEASSAASPLRQGVRALSMSTRSPSQQPPGSAAVPPSGPPSDPVGFLLDLFGVIEKEVDMRKVSMSNVHSRMYYKCTLKGYKAAPEITQFYSKELLQRLPPQWRNTPYWHWLERVSAQPFEPVISTPENIPLQLVRRKQSARAGLAGGGAPSATAPPRSSTAHDGSRGSPSPAHRGAGKRAALRIATTARKRPASELEDVVDDGDDDDSDRRAKKARSGSAAFADDTDGEDGGASSESDVLDLASDVDEDKKETVRLYAITRPLPSTRPTGPRGLWTCAQPGCAHAVAHADTEEGQEEIRRHFRHHERRAQARVKAEAEAEAQADRIDLAQAEAKRNAKSIDHLLDKIRAAGKKEIDEESVVLNGVVLPKPIKRRLLL